MRHFGGGLLLFLLQPSSGPAQDPPAFSSVSELVVLDIDVTDRHGIFIEGLTRDAFRVFEDDQPQTIEFFLDRDTPVTVGLLIDSSSSMQGRRSLVIAAAQAFAARCNPEDEIFALAFNDEVRAMLPPDAPFTSQSSTLGEALTQGIAAQGKTALFDALKAGLDYVARGHRERRALVVISDGGDNASRATFQEVLARAQASNAVIHTVALFDPWDHDVNPKLLKQVAAATGGKAFEPHDVHQIADVLQDVAQDIRNAYTVGYQSSNRGHEGSIRRVRVMVEPRDGTPAIVHTRPGYLTMAARQAEPERTARSVFDGVYTSRQAARGERVYGRECGRCHGPSLEGSQAWNPAPPPLVGAAFLGKWAGTTVGDLFEWVHATMPGDKMEPIGIEGTADAIAFILKANKFPAGQTELPRDVEALKQINFPPRQSGGT